VLRVKERGAHPTCNTGPIAVSSRKDHVHGVAGAENAHSPSSLSWLWEQASLEVGGQLNCLAWSASDNRSPGGRARRTPATELTRRKEYCPREGKQLQYVDSAENNGQVDACETREVNANVHQHRWKKHCMRKYIYNCVEPLDACFFMKVTSGQTGDMFMHPGCRSVSFIYRLSSFVKNKSPKSSLGRDRSSRRRR
jgi:hypothetical protein